MVEWAADRSFGVLLVHPVVLWLLTAAGPGSPSARIGTPWNNAVVYLTAVAGSLLIVEGLRRTPLSLAMTGKLGARRRPAPEPTRSVVPPPRVVIPQRRVASDLTGTSAAANHARPAQ
jgi:hypothetical protein